MAALAMTLGDFSQFQAAFTKGGVAVDLAGAQEVTFTLQLYGGVVLAQWGLTNGVTVNSPPTLGLVTLSVTPAMQAATNSPTLWPIIIRGSTPQLRHS